MTAEWCVLCRGMGWVRREPPWPLAGVLYPKALGYVRTCPRCGGSGDEPTPVTHHGWKTIPSEDERKILARGMRLKLLLAIAFLIGVALGRWLGGGL